MNIQDIYNTLDTKRQKSPAPLVSLLNVVVLHPAIYGIFIHV